MPHYNVLPQGNNNGMIPEPLPVMTVANKHDYKQSCKQTSKHETKINILPLPGQNNRIQSMLF